MAKKIDRSMTWTEYMAYVRKRARRMARVKREEIEKFGCKNFYCLTSESGQILYADKFERIPEVGDFYLFGNEKYMWRYGVVASVETEQEGNGFNFQLWDFGPAVNYNLKGEPIFTDIDVNMSLDHIRIVEQKYDITPEYVHYALSRESVELIKYRVAVFQSKDWN
jgi:hypothetical protein